MKDPFLSRRRKPATPKKLKLVCSFNGTFQLRPRSVNLRYTGGETKIITVDRNIGFAKLKSKISDLPLVGCPTDGLSICFSLKYQLPCNDYAAPLVLIKSDDDASGMVNEYEKLESLGKPIRLWIYVCNGNTFRYRIGKLSKTGSGMFFENNYGFGVESVNGYGSECDCNKVKKSVSGVNGVGVSDGLMTKTVLKQQLLAKESGRIRGCQCGLGLADDQNEIKLICEKQMGSRISLPQGHLCHETTEFKFGGNPYRSNVLDYEFRNAHSHSVTEMGNHRNLRWEGRPWVRKFYPGLRSSSSISKQGQTMRLFYPSLWKPWSGYHLHTLDSGKNDQRYSFDQFCTNKENLTNKGGHGVPQLQPRNPKEFQFAFNGASTARDRSLLHPIFANNLLTSTRGMDPREDLLTGSIGEKHEVPCQNLPGGLSSQSSCSDFEKESEIVEPMVNIDICGSPNTLGFGNGRESGCESELSNIESGVNPFSKHRNGAHVMPGGLASIVDLSFRNLSLSSSKEVEPTACTSPSSNDVSEALLTPQLKPVDLMVEELLTTGPQVEVSNGVSLDSFLNNAAKLEKLDEQEEEMQQDHPSNLSIDKMAEIGEHQNCSKGSGSIPGDLLQTIKNSDLEYIKELGSGTYGSVFHGKWNGCDVAIKKFKASCFNEGAQDQDKLVADFWKEAHILGQLHHPHVMALYGVVTDGPVTNLAAVTEYMVNGSLKQVLQRKDRTIDRRKRLIIAMDAAFGMEYLHEKKIVHFDLKSHNLLVNMRDPQRPVCKIGDLGLSKVKQRTLVSGGVRGTIPWMAPELLYSQKNMVTDKVDVYSFGIVMWELLTGEEPYRNMRSEEIIAGIIKGDLHPEIPTWCDPAWRSLMERCWSSDPDSRPAFSEIAKELRAMSAAMNIK